MSSSKVVDCVTQEDTRCKDNGREGENVHARTQREIRHLSSEGAEENRNQCTGRLSFREEDQAWDQAITSPNPQDQHKAVILPR